MKLILLENERSIDKLFSRTDYEAGADTIICFNYLVFLKLKEKKAGHKYIFYEELFSPGDYETLHSATDEFASRWYYSGGKDATLFDGVSFGNLVKVVFSRTYMTTILVKYGEALRKAIERFGQAELVLFDFSEKNNCFFYYADDAGRFFNKKRVIESAAKQLGVKTGFLALAEEELVPSAFVAHMQPEGDFSKFSVKKNIRKKVSSIADRLHNLVSYALCCCFPGKRAYFFNYFNISTFIKAYPGYLAIPGFGLKDHLRTFFSGLIFFDFERVSYAFSPEEEKFLGKIRKSLFDSGALSSDCGFSLNAIDYSEIYAPAIYHACDKLIPACLHYIGKVRKGLRSKGFSKAIINDIVDEKHSSFITACHLEKVPVSFVDHGIQSLHNAQKVVGSALPDEYFSVSGASLYDIPLKPLGLGNPSMDPYPEAKRKRVSSLKKVLFLTYQDSFYWRLDRFPWQEKYYAELFSAFRKLRGSGIEVYYRTHFENRAYHDYLFDFFKVDRSSFTLAEGGRFTDLIYTMDLLVCNVTNCFYEAQAAGVPAVFLDPGYIKDALLMPLSGRHGEEVLRLSNGEELAELIRRNKDNPVELNSFLDNFLKKYAPIYLGKLDGLASRRIADYLFKGKG